MRLMMNKFEKKIIMENKEDVHINSDDFLAKLHSRIQTSNTNRQTLFISLAFVFTVLLLIITEFGAPESKIENYFVDSTDNLLETDFWNIMSDSIDYDQDYYNYMAYFLLDEGYVWETVELIEQLEASKEES